MLTRDKAQQRNSGMDPPSLTTIPVSDGSSQQDRSSTHALRPSLFSRVPPFLNFVPTWDAISCAPNARAKQYWDGDGSAWDQDHLWRVPMLAARALQTWAKAAAAEAQQKQEDAGRKRRARRRSWAIDAVILNL